jgi:hypothetical protein
MWHLACFLRSLEFYFYHAKSLAFRCVNGLSCEFEMMWSAFEVDGLIKGYICTLSARSHDVSQNSSDVFVGCDEIIENNNDFAASRTNLCSMSDEEKEKIYIMICPENFASLKNSLHS